MGLMDILHLLKILHDSPWNCFIMYETELLTLAPECVIGEKKLVSTR